MNHTLFQHHLPHLYSQVASPQSGRPILCGGNNNRPCIITHPHGGYYTTKKTRTQGTIAHQAKTYAPHNLDIIMEQL